ncbi:uncharacterized protein K444DRAFT_208789 [Hyaloscypha bicolor E]|uniref:Uncharacterized protein n=1 Tax=Hyaloscypha bicolor E TaxID=1095630 RepID=A0A2J6TPG6_9HELO|nr:uncharacterized protein K444DRAFT_208789 [Hyaloscypha bicolor E]PMD64909.1 hypothetical protein K444DRAFT_208789 [Hyaloscypha bicolor E]
MKYIQSTTSSPCCPRYLFPLRIYFLARNQSADESETKCQWWGSNMKSSKCCGATSRPSCARYHT